MLINFSLLLSAIFTPIRSKFKLPNFLFHTFYSYIVQRKIENFEILVSFFKKKLAEMLTILKSPRMLIIYFKHLHSQSYLSPINPAVEVLHCERTSYVGTLTPHYTKCT